MLHRIDFAQMPFCAHGRTARKIGADMGRPVDFVTTDDAVVGTKSNRPVSGR